MVNILVGAVLGFLSGLGVGGGSLLLLWLTLVAGVSQETARVMNLQFFLPCALLATAFRWKQSKPNWKLILPAAAAGVLGAALGNHLGPSLDRELLNKAFGILFLLTGLRELRFKQ
ncbi:MAG: TSUP family transporter [Oscillospiraceae bacterium]|nr:TSUP family transporter [Oscillospiraceae bacterium]